MKKAIMILSGGMDSTTLLYYLVKRQEMEVKCLTFNYGQKHQKEIDAARDTCIDLGLDHKILNIEWLARMLKGSSLTDPEVKVPYGHYAEESMKLTVVPNRNMIMLSIASAYAFAEKADYVATATHAGDHAIYPDCRASFMRSLESLVNVGNLWFKPIEICNPFQNISKIDILSIGLSLKVDYSKTWTCYEGQELACGKCGACQERLEAFDKNGVMDPLLYPWEIMQR